MEFNPKTITEDQMYKLMLSCIVPRPIGWISTVSKNGVYNLAPFSFFNGVSSDPPLVMVSVGKKDSGAKKDTWKNIEETGEFVINLVTYDLIEEMNITATAFDEEVDEFKEAGLTPVKSSVVKPPRVKESPVNIECKKHIILEIADMGVVFGEIVNVHIEDSLVNDKGYLDTRKLNIVGRMGGADYCVIRESNTLTLKRLDKR